MIRDHDPDDAIRAFLSDEAREITRTASALDAAAARVAARIASGGSRTPAFRAPWRLPSISRVVPYAVAGLVVVIALIAIGIAGRSPDVGPPPTTGSPLPSATASPGPSATGSWHPGAPMLDAREGHTATLLHDGRVLVAGGSERATSELYDPGTGTWTAAGAMTEARVGHTATLLPDGRVLVVGGVRPGFAENGLGGTTVVASTELYDPATGAWSPAGDTLVARGRGHTATLLPNGRVLVAGGYPGGAMVASAELFDPTDGSWTPTASMSRGRAYHTATLLAGDSVLVAGSLHSDPSAELYDPVAGTWTTTGSMIQGRHDFAAVMLRDGRVLVAAYEGSSTTELYDPRTGRWNETGPMIDARLGTYWATLLPDGTVLATGGVPNRHATVERYDPDSGRWSRVTDSTQDRQYHTATLLPDGTVLVTGGGGLASAERYVPDSDD